MTIRYTYKGKRISKKKFNSYRNLTNLKPYLKSFKQLPPKKISEAQKKFEREVSRISRQKSKQRLPRKREVKYRQGLIIRDLEEDDRIGYKNVWEYAKRSGKLQLQVTRIRKTFLPGYRKVHKLDPQNMRYIGENTVSLPFDIGPGSSANEEIETFMEKVLEKYTRKGDEEFYSTIISPGKKVARTIAKRQEIPMELRRVRRRSKSR